MSAPFDQAEKYGLQYVFGISGTSGDAMGGAKDAIVVRSEEGFQLSGRVWHWFQGSNSCWHDCLLKSFPHSKRALGRLINKRGEVFSLESGRKGHFPYVICQYLSFLIFHWETYAKTQRRKDSKNQEQPEQQISPFIVSLCVLALPS
jgi:hypothetical protein